MALVSFRESFFFRVTKLVRLWLIGLFFLIGTNSQAEMPTEHPLAPLIRFAEKRLQTFDREVQDYTCLLVKRERINDRLRDTEHIILKLRHEQKNKGKSSTPFSVYLRYLAPRDVVNREVVYVDGQNRNQMIVWRGGTRMAYITTAVSPTSELALRWQHYPITEIGIKTLTERLLAMGKQEMTHNDCEVTYVEGAKINGRSCLMVQLTHPVRRPDSLYHIARVFIDDKLKLPIRYASYSWPAEKGKDPPLIEEYSYVNIKLNAGLSNQDFDYRNPAYRFRKTFKP